MESENAKVLKALLFASGVLLSLTVFAAPKQIRIGVIDTGIDLSYLGEARSRAMMCEGEAHQDFTNPFLTQRVLHDTHGHGTHIVGLIDLYASGYTPHEHKLFDLNTLMQKREGYCFIIYKAFGGLNDAQSSLEAMRAAVADKVDIINYSAGGDEFNIYERQVLQDAVNKGIKVIVAAGNDGCEYDKPYYLKDIRIPRCAFYPASYGVKGIEVVGALNEDGRTRTPRSNYGKYITAWELGKNVISMLPDGKWGFMTGTSQAAAIHTGKIIYNMLKSQH